MIIEFVNKTAEWMIKQRQAVEYEGDHEEESPSRTGIFPSHSMMRPAWSWGPSVDKLEYGAKKHVQYVYDKLSISIR